MPAIEISCAEDFVRVPPMYVPIPYVTPRLMHSIGYFMIMLGTIGFLVNFWNTIMLIRSIEYRNVFGCLSTHRSLINMYNLLVFVFWMAPGMLLANPIFMNPYWNNVVWFSVLIVSNGMPLLMLAVSVNRILAIYFPFTCSTARTALVSTIIIVSSLLIGISSVLYDYISGCSAFFEPRRAGWVYTCVDRLALITTYPLFACSVTTIVLNTIVIIHIHVKMSGCVKAKRKKNIRLFWQCVIQEIFISISTIFNPFDHALGNTFLGNYIENNLLWELSHVLDGLVFMVFNRHLMKHWRREKVVRSVQLFAVIVPMASMAFLQKLFIFLLGMNLSLCLTEVQLARILADRQPAKIPFNDVINVKQIGSIAGEPLFTHIGHRLPPGERIIVRQP